MSGTCVTVDPMQLADLHAVIEIERQSNSHPWTEQNFRDAVSSGYVSLVARDHGHVCAFAIARTLVDEAELLLIAVAPSQRRQGIAARLWTALARRLRTNGATKVFLEVRASNASARSFYGSLGFEPMGVRKKYYPNGVHDADREDAILMQVAL